jgi:hypothetical protein
MVTTLQGTERYLPPGIRQYRIVQTFANYKTPTKTELDAGTDVTAEVVDGSVTGFKTTTSTVEAPDVGSKISRKASGRTSLDDSSISFYIDEAGNPDARTLLADGTRCFVVDFPEGDHVQTPALTCNIWPVQVLSTDLDPDTTKLGQCQINFAVTDLPAKNVAIPTV